MVSSFMPQRQSQRQLQSQRQPQFQRQGQFQRQLQLEFQRRCEILVSSLGRLGKQFFFFFRILIVASLFIFADVSGQTEDLSGVVRRPLQFSLSIEQGRRHFAQGVGFYNARSYDAALRHFFTALEKLDLLEGETVKRSTIRYFIGLTYEKLGYRREALYQWNNIIRFEETRRLNEIQDLRDKISFLQAPTFKQQADTRWADNQVGRATTETLEYRLRYSFPSKGTGKMGLFSFLTKRNKRTQANNIASYELITPIAIRRAAESADEFYVMDISTYRLRRVNIFGDEVSEHTPFRVPYIYYGLKRPYDFIVTADGRIWATDLSRDELVELDPSGKVIQRLGGTGIADGELMNPRGVTEGPAGSLWVADSGNARLQVFAADGTWQRTLGSRGEGSGQYSYPTRLLYDKRAEVFYVLDSGAGHVQVLSQTGHPLFSFGEDFLSEPLDLKLIPGTTNGLFILDRLGLYRIADPLASFRLGGEFSAVVDARRITLYGTNEKIRSGQVVTRAAITASLEMDTRSTTVFPYLAVLPHLNGDLYLANGKTGQLDIYTSTRHAGMNNLVQVEYVDANRFPELHVEVSVRDEGGRPVAGLQVEDFSFYEEGKKIGLVSAVPLGQGLPLRTVFMVESSPLSRERSQVFATIWQEWMAAMAPDDMVLPLLYGDSYDGGSSLEPRFSESRSLIIGKTFVTPALRRVTQKQLADSLVHANDGRSPLAERPRMGFASLLQHGLEKLIPYSDRQGIVILAFTPHVLGDWQTRPTGQGAFGLTHFMEMAQAHRIPVYVIYAGDEAINDPLLTPLRTFAETTGGAFLDHRSVSVPVIVANIHRSHQGRYLLGTTSYKRPLGRGLFYPIAVHARIGEKSGRDSWNGFIHP